MDKNKIVGMIDWIFCAGMGLVNFILLAIPYMTLRYMGLGYTGGASQLTYAVTKSGVSGYAVLGWTTGGAFGAACAFQIMALIVGLAMLVFGVLGILGALGYVRLPEKIGAVRLKQIVRILFVAFIVLNVIELFCLGAVQAKFSDTVTYGNETFKTGYFLSAGVFLTLAVSAGAFVAMIMLSKKNTGVATVAAQTGDAHDNAKGRAEEPSDENEKSAEAEAGDKR